MTNCAADELGGDFGNDIRGPWIIAPGTFVADAWAAANQSPAAYLEYIDIAPLRIPQRRLPLWSVP